MAQKLDPQHKEMYERVMNTPTKKPAAAPEPKPNLRPETTASPPNQKSAFLSSMPIQPSKSLGVKTFTFSGGKKKVSKDEPKEESPKPATSHETKPAGEKKKASPMLITAVVIGFIALWGAFWAFILGFI